MIGVGLSHMGKMRKSNQDSLYVSKDKDFPLYILADGMGGHKAGEVASSMAVQNSLKVFKENMDRLNSVKEIEDIIIKAMEKSNNEIYKESLEDKNHKGMGTTLIIMYIFNNQAIIGHVGDSRLYILDDTITQITEDHSLVNELVKSGEITKEEARKHPKKNILTKAVGAKVNIEISTYIYRLKTDDIVLICSDGLTDMVLEEDIYKLIESDDDIYNICEKLIKKANENGGKDNITTILVEI